MRRYFSVLVLLGLAFPACESFTCSQERIKAIELANRGADAFRNNLYDSAEKDFKEAILKDPTFELAHYNLGKLYQKQRLWDKAAEAFEAAVQRAPNNANYLYDLGEAYLEGKKFEQAEKALVAATKADPKLFKAHWRLGLTYRYLDKPKEADLALRAAIEANPRLDKPFIALGYLYFDYDFDNEAAQVFSECLRANPSSAECVNGSGVALRRLKKFDQATAQFQEAMKMDGGLYDAVYNLGMTYADWYEESNSAEHKERAREHLKQFVATGGGKDAGLGYVRAANDKLYALSGQ